MFARLAAAIQRGQVHTVQQGGQGFGAGGGTVVVDDNCNVGPPSLNADVRLSLSGLRRFLDLS